MTTRLRYTRTAERSDGHGKEDGCDREAGRRSAQAARICVLRAIMFGRKWLIVLFGALLWFDLACTKDEPAEPVSTIEPSERVAPSPVGTSQTVLEKTFALKDTATFPFEIPAHATMPHLNGLFVSFAGQAHGASDDTANIDFLVLNEDQQTELQGNARARQCLRWRLRTIRRSTSTSRRR